MNPLSVRLLLCYVCLLNHRSIELTLERIRYSCSPTWACAMLEAYMAMDCQRYWNTETILRYISIWDFYTKTLNNALKKVVKNPSALCPLYVDIYYTMRPNGCNILAWSEGAWFFYKRLTIPLGVRHLWLSNRSVCVTLLSYIFINTTTWSI